VYIEGRDRIAHSIGVSLTL